MSTQLSLQHLNPTIPTRKYNLNDLPHITPSKYNSNSSSNISPTNLNSLISIFTSDNNSNSLFIFSKLSPPIKYYSLSSTIIRTIDPKARSKHLDKLNLNENTLHHTLQSNTLYNNIMNTSNHDLDTLSSSIYSANINVTPDSTNKILIPPNYLPSSTLSNNINFTYETLQKYVGFQNMEKFTKRLLSTAQITIHIDNLGCNTTLDQGEVEIIYKKPRNTSPLIRLSKNTLIFHYDFAYGTNTELEEIKYAVFLVDRRSKYIFEYPLINLNEDKLLDAMKLFINQLRRKPDKMYVDQDYKLVGGKITKFLRNPFDDEYNLLPNGSLLASAPKGRQNQNDLSEINWKEVMNMSRNLITSNLLPSSFWYHGISYTLQVINYMPTRYSNGKWSFLLEQL